MDSKNNFGNFKSHRKLEYALEDFKLQRQNSLGNLEEKKNYYSDLITAYFNSIPKIVLRRCLYMNVSNFEFQNNQLIIDYKKHLDQKLSVLKDVKKDVFKYGGTPIKYKIVYSATKRKSLAKQSVRHFELKKVCPNGTRTVLSTAKKSSKKLYKKKDTILSENNSECESLTNETIQLNQKVKEYQITKIKSYRENIHNNESIYKNQINDFFINLIKKIPKSELNSSVSLEKQKEIVNFLFK